MPRHLQRRVFFKAFRVLSVVIGLECRSTINPNTNLDQAQKAAEAAGVSCRDHVFYVSVSDHRSRDDKVSFQHQPHLAVTWVPQKIPLEPAPKRDTKGAWKCGGISKRKRSPQSRNPLSQPSYVNDNPILNLAGYIRYVSHCVVVTGPTKTQTLKHYLFYIT